MRTHTITHAYFSYSNVIPLWDVGFMCHSALGCGVYVSFRSGMWGLCVIPLWDVGCMCV